jgi:hypothetical protein
MTWTYDSKLLQPTRTLVQRAVVNLLAPMKAPTGFLADVIPIGFGIASAHDELAIDLLMTELLNRMPAIAVATCDLHDEPSGAPQNSRGKLEVDVYFLSQNRRGLTEGRVTSDTASTTNNARDPGVYAMMELAWQFLFDAPLVLDNTKLASRQRAQTLIRVSETELLSDESTSLWKQRWTTMVTLDVNLHRALAQKLVNAYTTLHPTGEPAAVAQKLDSR